MELILLILKIILIGFAVVLGIIFLILGMVLFIPIQYEVSGSIGDSFEIRIKGKVTYFLSIIKALFLYEEKTFSMKLFFFGFEKKEKKEEAAEEIIEATEEDTEISMRKKIKPDECQEGSEEFEQYESLEGEKETEQLKEVEVFETVKETKVSNSAKVNKSKALKEKRFRRKKVRKEKSEKKQKTQKKENKFDFAFVKQQLTDEHNYSVVRKIFIELGYLFKHFKFRKIITDLEFSTGDPAATGQSLGVLCMIPALYRYDFKIVPDFEAEKAYLKGTFLAAGRVRMLHILITLLRLIFDKEVRIVIKKIFDIVRQ